MSVWWTLFEASRAQPCEVTTVSTPEEPIYKRDEAGPERPPGEGRAPCLEGRASVTGDRRPAHTSKQPPRGGRVASARRHDHRKQLGNGMPDTPKKLQDMVIEDIRWMAGPNAPPETKPKQKLDIAYGLTAYQRKALAAPFESTARVWKSDAKLSRAACANLGTVEDAVALVSKAAGFNGTWVSGVVQ
jgi:hypothetical protein